MRSATADTAIPVQFASEMRRHFMSALQMGNQGMVDAPCHAKSQHTGKDKMQGPPFPTPNCELDVQGRGKQLSSAPLAWSLQGTDPL